MLFNLYLTFVIIRFMMSIFLSLFWLSLIYATQLVNKSRIASLYLKTYRISTDIISRVKIIKSVCSCHRPSNHIGWEVKRNQLLLVFVNSFHLPFPSSFMYFSHYLFAGIIITIFNVIIVAKHRLLPIYFLYLTMTLI